MNIIFKKTHNSNFSNGRSKPIRYIVIHYTGNNGDTAKNNADYYANNKVRTSAHYFVDEFDAIYQGVKDTNTAWHCGSKYYKHPICRNENSIGIEICSRNPKGVVSSTDPDWYFKENSISNAIKLTKLLMGKYNIPLENVIRHYDVTGKVCPAPFVNNQKEWIKFKEMLSVNRYSYHDTVERMIVDGVTNIENMAHWEMVFEGKLPPNPKYVEAIIKKYSEKLRG